MGVVTERRVALIGGGSRGIGFASAEALAAAGCDIALWSSDRGRLENAVNALDLEQGQRAVVVAHDASEPSCAREVFAEVQERLGSIDIVVMNGGGPPVSDPTATSREVWISAFQSVFLTQVELATMALPTMRERKWGRIVALMSTGVRQPIPDLPYSNSCRAALAAWLKSCAPVVAPDGVTVNGVLTGRIDTERARQLDTLRAARRGVDPQVVRAGREEEIPSRRYGRPEELASLVAYLCSQDGSYLTGALIPVDGGLVAAL